MEQNQSDGDSGPLWGLLAEAASRLESDPDEAERRAQSVLKTAPGQQQALQVLVAARRLNGDVAGARATLERLASELPDLAAIHYELALLLSDAGDAEAAARTFSRVVELEPKHPQAWQLLGDALMQAGDAAGAANAYAQQFASSVMDLKTLEQVGALDLAQLGTVENVLREFLNICPTDLSALQAMGRLHMRANQFESAERIFTQALEIAPGFRAARLDLIHTLQKQLRPEDEIRQLDILLSDEPDNVDYRAMRASALSASGNAPEALRYCEELIRAEPDRPRFWLVYGRALRAAGRQAECIAALRKAVELEPQLGEGWWGLADLKTFRFAPADVGVMRAELLGDQPSDENRLYLHFALGKALEDAYAFEDSFSHYRQGNALVRSANPYNGRMVAENVAREKRRFTREFFRAHERAGCHSVDPIFIVGIARSGSTLVEQILASHSSVEGAGELPSLTTLVRHLEGKREPNGGADDAAALFEGEDLNALGQEYLERCRRYRSLSRPHFTDKLLSNFHHLGVICAILPNARIIDIRRHPLACCLSNFKQIFPFRQGPSYDLGDMGCYYRGYVELMAHFDRVLPGRVHRMIYEDLVEEPEREVRRLLEYCGLTFEAACLRFHETRRGVLTVSSEQVKRPLYADAVEHWRHYEQWLGPLKTSLGPVLDAYPAVPDML
jgi:tetratricopeptide (TPR) repeat protein